MKKIIILIAILFSLNCNTSFGQTILKPKESNKNNLSPDILNYVNIQKGFRHNGKYHFLVEEMNFISNIGITFRHIIPRFYFNFDNAFEKLHLITYDTTTNKISKKETIKTDLKNQKYDLLTTIQKGDLLNIYLSVPNKKVLYILCVQYNLATKQSKTVKMLECNKNEICRVSTTKDEGKISFAIVDDKAKTAKFSYLISDINMNILDFAEKISIPKIKNKDILDFIITKNNSLLVETSEVAKKGNLFKGATLANNIYLINKGKLKKVDFPGLNGFTTNKRLFFDKDNNLRIACLYSDKKFGKKEGIYLATLDETANTIIKEKVNDYEDFDIQGDTKRQVKKTTKGLQGSSSLTDFDVSPDGKLYLLFETKTITTRTTSSGVGANRTYTTRTVYNYGPGAVYSIDDNNSIVSTHVFEYKKSFSDNDPGKGITIYGSNGGVIIDNSTKLTKYNLNENIKSYKIPNDIGAGLKMLFRAFAGKVNFAKIRVDDALFDIELYKKKEVSLKYYNLLN